VRVVVPVAQLGIDFALVERLLAGVGRSFAQVRQPFTSIG
jgi:hypothetical protein